MEQNTTPQIHHHGNKIAWQDLRTPMNAILSFSRLAQSEKTSIDSKRYCSKIYHAALQLQGMLDLIMEVEDLDYSEVEVTERKKVGKVLVVDDDALNRQVADIVLQKIGLKVDLVEDSVKAVKAICSKSYDLVLMDLQMPGIDGFAACRVIRKKGYTKLPIVALTADVSKDVGKKCEEVGMVDYLTKPIVPKKLYATISKWIS